MPWRSFLPTSWFPSPGGASSALSAPQNLEQPILPGWVFGSVVNVNDQNSAAPQWVLIDERAEAGGDRTISSTSSRT